MASAARLVTVVAAGLVGFAGLGGTIAARPGQQTSSATIQGVVTRAGSSDPIPDVQISVTVVPEERPAGTPQAPAAPRDVRGSPTPPVTLTATSDAAGHFSLSVPEGSATVVAQRVGYFGPSLGGTTPTTVSTTVSVSSRQPADVRLAMVPGGTINGRVSDLNGKPLVNTPVGVVRRIYRSGVPALDLVDGKASDDRGAYRLFQLPPGEYYVVALQGRRGVGEAFAASASNEPSPVTTFYPNAIDLGSAIAIDLKPGDDLAGIDVQIRSELTHTVSGRVTSSLPPGSEVSAINRQVRATAAQLSLLPRDATMVPDLVTGNIVANQDGTFQIRGVLPGSYDLVARLPASVGWGPQNGPERATNPWALGKTAVEVGGADVDGVTVNVHQGVDVHGRVTVDGTGEAAAVRVTMQPDDNVALYNNFFGTITNWAPFLEADGSFTLPLMPESHYRIRVGLISGPTRAPMPNAQGQLPPTPVPLPPNAYVADVQQGGRSVYDEGLTVGSDPIGPVEVVIKSDGGTVSGTVTGTDAKAAHGKTVVLVPEVSRRKNLALFKVASTDELGRFTISRVPPGSYKLFAWDSIVAGAYESPQFLEAYEARGTDVKVNASATITTDLTTIR
jgi:polysaccharide lyase family 4-like protein